MASISPIHVPVEPADLVSLTKRVEAAEANAAKFRKTLNEIRFSCLADFPTALEWAQWCRNVASETLEDEAQR